MSDERTRANEDGDLRERLRVLEQRLEQMERGGRIKARARSRWDSVVPRDAVNHFRSASREQLLGVRTLVDHWIGRIDAPDEVATPPERETIEVS